MRRNCSHLFPLISILILFSTFSYGQAWSGILAPSRAIDWSNAGLPATLPDGETTPNPWTPPSRTTICTTLSPGTSVSAINSALSNCSSGGVVLLNAGTYSLSGTITVPSNVTLRGSGGTSTVVNGATISVGGGTGYSGSSMLTASPAKGATSITVAAAPTAGRLIGLEECDDGFSASSARFTQYASGVNCTGAYSDPHGPWICELSTACNTNGDGGGNTNPHFQGVALWVPAGGVSGDTVNFTTPLASDNWTTARTASIWWPSNPGTTGAGIEDLTFVGAINFSGSYACWIKGVRLLTTSGARILNYSFDAHSLVANSYIGSTVGAPNGSPSELINWGSDGGGQEISDHLFINNIIDGGYTFGMGMQIDQVDAYNYWYTAYNSSWVENGEANHHAGVSFMLREGNEEGMSEDDPTWGTHNFNTWFRDYVSCTDPTVNPSLAIGLEIGSYARFENIIGGAYGRSGSTGCSSSYATTIYLNQSGIDTTGLTQGSAMVWGNYALCGGGDSHCNTVSFDSAQVPTNLSSFGANSTPYQNSVPASHNLPASFFMNSMAAYPNGGTGLSWWKTCTSWTIFPTSCASYTTPPMPPIGPDVTGGQSINGYAYKIPAALAWAGLPNDTNYPTPWGYLRQFDERVYENDGGDPPTPPTGLTAVVQ
jgi:Pectate lyase superfamily protein